MKKIVWDWNGTLLDDLEYSLGCIRQVQKEWGVSPFESADDYRRVFCFPISDYYAKAGFDCRKQDWKIPGNRFMELYVENVNTVPLAKDAIEALAYAKQAGMASYIVSATRRDLLKEQVSMHPLLAEYLCGVYGIGDIYASSKEAAAFEFLSACLPADELYVIGDTAHDGQIARAIGAQFIAVCNGHQLPEAFEEGVHFCKTILEAVRWIDARSENSGQ